MKSNRTDKPSRQPQQPGSSLARALEPRFMFDAAGLVTALDAPTDELSAADSIGPAEQTDGTQDSSHDNLIAALADASPAAAGGEIVFVDTSVTNYEALLEGITPGAEVVLLDADNDGLQQIADALEGRTDIRAIHIISHGEAGELHLGDTVLTQSSMQGEYSALLASLGDSLQDDADILIYGCNYADGEDGQRAADILSTLTGADVAASDDLTGHSTALGNWDLEYQTGSIEASSAVSEQTQASWQHLLMDADGDGVDDATDIDDDNDGITDTNEGYQTVVTLTPDPIDVDGNGATTETYIALPDTVSVGDFVTITNVLANGDLNAGTEYFTLIFNRTFTSETNLGGTQFDTNGQTEGLEPVIPGNQFPISLEVIDISAAAGDQPGIRVSITSSAQVDDLANLGYGVRMVFDIQYTINIDTDGDGIDDYLDIDSDNDGITDNFEAQATNAIVLPSGIAAGITDTNGGSDGLDDNYHNGGNGLTPVDTDGDLTPDWRDADSDDDGVDDIAERGDGQPTTVTSATDTDGDGLLDIFEGGTISDQDVNDDNLIFGTQINLADSDDDLAIDGSDALGTVRNLDFRENSLLDIDEDGIDNADDLDADNDGILNEDEGAPGNNLLEITTTTYTVAPGPVTEAPFDIDLSGTGLSIGDTITIDNILADGDLNGTGEDFDLIFNQGDDSEVASLDMANNRQFQGLAALTTPVSKETRVIDIGGGTPGITVVASTPQEVDDLGFGYGVQYQFDITADISISRDSDGDGLADHLDIDSDNDGITDNVEAQLTASYIAPNGVIDANGVDTAYNGLPGGGLTPVDSDGDSVNDVLDIDSDADGVGDIAERRDGQATTITSNLDSDQDGLLDIFEGSNVNDEDPNDENVPGTSYALADTDGDLSGNWANASPPDTDLDFREGDFDGDGVLNGDDLDADNDGVLNTDEGLTAQTFASGNIDAGNGPNTTSYDIDLSSTTLNIGDTVSIDTFQADGDLDNGNVEMITELNFNSGQAILNNLQTYEQFQGLTELLYSPGGGGGSISPIDLTVIDIGNGTPGISVSISVNADVDQFGGNAYSARVNFVINYDQPTDSDGDGFFDHLDIDSDNDGITDNVEAQATEDYVAPTGTVNASGVDNAYSGLPGGGISPVNTDGADQNDILDADSDADGLNDIAERGDGQPVSITSTTDSDADGLLDIFEGSTINDIDPNDDNLDGSNNFLLSDSDDDTDADGANALPLIRDVDFRDDLRDIDADSIPNISDDDADGDGILNAADGIGVDTDSDGIENYLDIDSDNDGITDNVEAQTTQGYTPPTGTVDGNGVDNAYNGLPGGGLNPVNTDGDGTDDFLDADSDNDGIDDISERGDGQPRSIISTLDVDADGLLDIFEGSVKTDIDPNDENLTGSNFNLGDVDNDTAADGSDANPTGQDLDYRDLADTDGDGVPNINDIDADNDGILNINEGSGSNTDTDGDGVFDYLDLDSDNDGLSDLFESGASGATIALDANNDGAISPGETTGDADGDGLVDPLDANDADTSTGASVGTSPITNTDGDGSADFRDLDSDGDGIPDTVEFRATSGYTTNDGDVRDDDEDGDGILAAFDANDDPLTGSFGGSFSNTAVDSDGDGTPDYRDTNSDDDLTGNDSAEGGSSVTGLSYADPDGSVANPVNNLPNQFGDTTEVAFRERAFEAIADRSEGEVNEISSSLALNIISNDTFDNANGALSLSVTSVSSGMTGGPVAVPGGGQVTIDTTLGGRATINSDGSITYDPNNQAVFNNLDFGDDPLEDTFTYTLSYGGGETDTATVTIVVSPNNEFELDSLTGSNGTVFTGANELDQAGFKVDGLGDINGDGYDDIAITAVTASPNGNTYAGAAYVLFGKAGSFGATYSLGALASGDGSEGFVLNGISSRDLAGRSITSGDIDGDGFSDIIVAASSADTANGENTGEAYVLFGRNSTDFNTLLGGSGSFNLSTLTTGSTDGFAIRGIAEDDNAGRSVAFAGDVNGDGIGDLLVSGHLADPNTNTDSGETYLIYGQSKAAFVADLTSGVYELSDLASGDGSNGVVFNGAAAGDQSGYFIAGAGDFNGDGLDDFVIGAPYASSYAGTAYLILGQSAGFGGATFNLSGLTATNGYEFTGSTGSFAGIGLGLSGDLNGDGLADLVVSAPAASPNGETFSGTTYVIFGQGAAFSDTQTLAASADVTLNGATSEYNSAGFALDTSGDINGDGFDDLLLGRGPFYGIDAGAVYVVFGDPSISANIELDSLIPFSIGGTASSTNDTGFFLSGVDFDSYTGQSLKSAGDVNGDGFEDLIIGAYAADPNYAGEAYLVFGVDFSAETPQTGTSGADLLLGNTSAEVIIGGDGNDYIDGAGDDDILLGGNGDDTLIFDSVDTQRIDGGGGNDTLDFTDNSGVTLDLTSIANTVYRDIEIIDLTGAGNNTLQLNTADLLALSGSTNILTVKGNTGDAVVLTDFGSWTSQGVDGEGYSVYTNGEATIRIQGGVSISAVDTDAEMETGTDQPAEAIAQPATEIAQAELTVPQGLTPFSQQISLAADTFNTRAQQLLDALARV